MEIIIASNNKGKIAEFKRMLEPLDYQIYSQSEKNINIEVEETGTTFEENAFLKAKAIFDIAHTCVISDDSGIEVEELNNEPGIYSARYKGLKTDRERRLEILKQMEGKENRKARYVCCVCFINEKGEEKIFKGIWNGKLSHEEKGENGFGYDFIFMPDSLNGKTAAEVSIEEKNESSHRAIALNMLLDYLKQGEN